MSHLARFASGDYAAYFLWFASINLLPLIVVQQAGTTANAYFYQAWTITFSLYLVSRYFGLALIAEGVRRPDSLAHNSYRLTIQSGRLLVPAVAIFVLGAPYILGLYGPAYAEEGTMAFRLLCLSALPDLIITIYMSILRTQSRMKALLVITSRSGGGARRNPQLCPARHVGNCRGQCRMAAVPVSCRGGTPNNPTTPVLAGQKRE